MRINYQPLYGKIVTLTRPQRKDYVSLGKIFNDPANMEQVDVYRNPTKQEVEQIWHSHNQAINEQRAVRFTIKHNKDNEVIGCCGFGVINLSDAIGNYGIILDHHCWHRGIAEECMILVLDYGFKVLGLKGVEVSTKKTRGVRFLQKLGFIFQEIKDVVQIGDLIAYDIATYRIDKMTWEKMRRSLVKSESFHR